MSKTAAVQQKTPELNKDHKLEIRDIQVKLYTKKLNLREMIEKANQEIKNAEQEIVSLDQNLNTRILELAHETEVDPNTHSFNTQTLQFELLPAKE